jgi:phosphoribosylformylglycinamidine cyclo-ligase
MNSKYRESGVDIDAAGRAMKRAGSLIRKTWNRQVLSETGSFGGLFRVPDGYREPVLVSSVDGVGTKLKVAFRCGRHDTVGEDLVNHCVNDILVQGARPLFFLDYLGTGKLDPEVVEQIISGFAAGCEKNGCALIGGETAEMPGFYSEGEYDLSGTIVGIVEKSEIIDGSRIAEGDAVWGFPSSGLHTNGYSLARKVIFEDLGMGVDEPVPESGMTVAEALLAVHRSYLPEIEEILGVMEINGLVHITGGGFLDNIPRVLPEGRSVEIDPTAWDIPAIFRFLQDKGQVSRDEMFRVFNMGIGMVFIISEEDEERLSGLEHLRWSPVRLGSVISGDRNVRLD